VKRVSEDIEAVGYYYADSAEVVYARLAPSSCAIYDSQQEALGNNYDAENLYRITFKVEPV